MKTKSNSYILEYLGIFILLLFIVLPPLLRALLPKEDNNTPVVNNVVMKLSCNKSESSSEYKLTRNIDSLYENGQLVKTIFTYNVIILDQAYTLEDIVIDEYEDLKKVPNAQIDKDKNKYIITLDYLKNDYLNNENLVNHTKIISEQLQHYSKEKYTCTTERQR